MIQICGVHTTSNHEEGILLQKHYWQHNRFQTHSKRADSVSVVVDEFQEIDLRAVAVIGYNDSWVLWGFHLAL